jgi:hypothetical protein
MGRHLKSSDRRNISPIITWRVSLPISSVSCPRHLYFPFPFPASHARPICSVLSRIDAVAAVITVAQLSSSFREWGQETDTVTIWAAESKQLGHMMSLEGDNQLERSFHTPRAFMGDTGPPCGKQCPLGPTQVSPSTLSRHLWPWQSIFGLQVAYQILVLLSVKTRWALSPQHSTPALCVGISWEAIEPEPLNSVI